MSTEYDSRPDTIEHALRVRQLLMPVIRNLNERSKVHDASKTHPPELEVFDVYTPKLKHSTYGSEEYKGFLAEMKPALDHHYAENRHHPEHFEDGVVGMTLVDLIEMLADWKAATERHADGSLPWSLHVNQERFQIDWQLYAILENTARYFGWMSRVGNEEIYEEEE